MDDHRVEAASVRFLCVCNGGNCRSVAVAEILKGQYGHEAIAVGTYWFSEGSMRKLSEWADRIFVVEPFDAELPQPDLSRWQASPIWGNEFTHKRVNIALGPDRWGHNKWDELKQVAHAAVKKVLS